MGRKDGFNAGAMVGLVIAVCFGCVLSIVLLQGWAQGLVEREARNTAQVITAQAQAAVVYEQAAQMALVRTMAQERARRGNGLGWLVAYLVLREVVPVVYREVKRGKSQ